MDGGARRAALPGETSRRRRRQEFPGMSESDWEGVSVEGDQGGEECQEEPEGEVKEEKVDQPIPNPLTAEILSESLSLLCKTGNALGHAYIHVDLRDRELTDINALRSFIHLRFVDVSGNLLQDLLPLANLTHLLTLNTDRNDLSSPYLEELPFLQGVSLAWNRINTAEGISHPLLEDLNLSHNKIRTVSGFDPVKLSHLHTLELRGNLLESLSGINLPHLKKLYLAANQIHNLRGLEFLTGLETLHLRENHLERLEGFSDRMVSLHYLNVRGNLIVDIQELKHLRFLPKLRSLVIAENSCADDDSHRLEALILIPGLERLDKDAITREDRDEAAQALQLRESEGAERLGVADG